MVLLRMLKSKMTTVIIIAILLGYQSQKNMTKYVALKLVSDL